jgi:hypothetical protein
MGLGWRWWVGVVRSMGLVTVGGSRVGNAGGRRFLGREDAGLASFVRRVCFMVTGLDLVFLAAGVERVRAGVTTEGKGLRTVERVDMALVGEEVG